MWVERAGPGCQVSVSLTENDEIALGNLTVNIFDFTAD